MSKVIKHSSKSPMCPLPPPVHSTGMILGLSQKSSSTWKITFSEQALGFCLAKAVGGQQTTLGGGSDRSSGAGSQVERTADTFSDRNSKLVLFHMGLILPEETNLRAVSGRVFKTEWSPKELSTGSQPVPSPGNY